MKAIHSDSVCNKKACKLLSFKSSISLLDIDLKVSISFHIHFQSSSLNLNYYSIPWNKTLLKYRYSRNTVLKLFIKKNIKYII